MSELTSIAEKALMEGAAHIHRLFGKGIEEIGIEYKPKDGDTPRTLIDTNAQAEILSILRADGSPYRKDTFDAEEDYAIRGKSRVLYIDPFDGTSNADIKLPMSTMGIAVEQDNRVIAGVILNPFEHYIISAEEGKGVYKTSLTLTDGRYEINSTSKLEPRIKSNAKERFAWVDALFNAKTVSRKASWLENIPQLASNVRMTGSNIDYTAKIANGQGDIQLTDAVGGFYDIAPGIVIFRELGGRMMDLEGNEPIPGCQVAVGCIDMRIKDALLEITNNAYGKNSPQGVYTGFR